MTTPSAPCRVTVVAPSSRIDVALPRECTLAEVIPQLVRLAGAPPQPGDHSTGWGLSRLGEPALAPGLTVSAAALRDGEVLHLRPRERHEPPLLFDDVVDAIASAAENRRGSWRPAVGRRLALTAAALLFLASALLVLAGLSGRPAVAWGVGVVSLLLLLAGGGLVRGLGDPQAGVACAAAGLLAAPLAGATAPPPYVAWPPEAGSLALALGATTVYAALAATVVAHATAWFVAVATAAGCGALATATVLLFDVRPAHAAAVTAPLVVALAAAAPMVALRLAGLPRPRVPSDMESFRADDQPTPGAEVLGRTEAAADLLTGLVGALGAVAAGCCAVLLLDAPSTWSAVLVGLTGLAWLLRSRAYAGAAQRVVLVVVGLVILTGLGLLLASTVDWTWLLGVAAAVAVSGAVCLWYAQRVARNTHSPATARWFDALEYAALIALVPVAGAVLGVYQAVREAVG